MRTKVTLILLFLNVALFFFIAHTERQGRTEAELTAARRRVLGPETANIDSLTIASTNPVYTLKLVRHGDEWALTQPLEWPANEFAVKRIIHELQFLEHDTSFLVKDLAKNGLSLADYGLEKPPLTVTFTPAPPTPDAPPSQPIVLKIGDTVKAGNRLYVLSPDGERVHVVSRSLIESLAVKLDDLRADTLFTIRLFEIASFIIRTSPVNVHLAHDLKTNRWSFTNPITTGANKNATEIVLSQLDGLRALAFVDSRNVDPSRTGLTTPAFRLTQVGNNRQETLVIGAKADRSTSPASPPPAPSVVAAVESVSSPAATGTTPTVSTSEYYAQIEGKSAVFTDGKSPVFTVAIPDDLLETLRNAQEKLREKRILDFDPTSVTAVTVAALSPPELTLQRLDPSAPGAGPSSWQIVRPSAQGGIVTQPADREIVNRLLQSLSNLTALKFGPDAPSAADRENYGFNRPVRQVTLSLAAAQGSSPSPPSSLVLQLGSANGSASEVYAKLASPDYIYQVPADILREIPASPLAYRDRLLGELPVGAQITALKLTDLVNQSVVLDTPIPVPAPAAGSETPDTMNRLAIDALVAHLRVLRAKAFVADEFTKTVFANGQDRPWRYQLDATLTLVGGSAGQTTKSTLFFSERAGGNTQFVGSPTYNVVFEAEQPLLDAVFALTYGPQDPGPRPASAAPAPASPPAPNAPAADAKPEPPK